MLPFAEEFQRETQANKKLLPLENSVTQV